MKEKIFNLFYFTNGKFITELGAVSHIITGSDSEKIIFLQSLVNNDFKISERFSPPFHLCSHNKNGVFTIKCFKALARRGETLIIFEEILKKYNVSNAPLVCITAIINNNPKIDTVHDVSYPLYCSKYQNHPKIGTGIMRDYLKDYMTLEGFDLARLINNDYLEATKLLFNNKHYVSCMKLFVSYIDTLAFIEYGDTYGNFTKWLDEYADMNKLGVTSSQLWELRNSILHMSNLDSRKVLEGKEKRISFCVAKAGYIPEPDYENQYFNLTDFIEIIAQAASKWGLSYNQNPEKRTAFIERYDTVLSDERHAIFHI